MNWILKLEFGYQIYPKRNIIVFKGLLISLYKGWEYNSTLFITPNSIQTHKSLINNCLKSIFNPVFVPHRNIENIAWFITIDIIFQN
jgi:hypothetical protein